MWVSIIVVSLVTWSLADAADPEPRCLNQCRMSGRTNFPGTNVSYTYEVYDYKIEIVLEHLNQSQAIIDCRGSMIWPLTPYLKLDERLPLHTLTLRNCTLPSISLAVFPALNVTTLRLLELSDPPLDVHFEQFQNVTTLEITAQDEILENTSSLDFLKALPSLRSLTMNRITMPANLSDLLLIENLELSNTGSETFFAPLRGCANLRRLHVMRSDMLMLHKRWLENCLRLTEVSVDYAQNVDFIPKELFFATKSLKYLIFKHSSLKSLPEGLLNTNSKLLKLDMSWNQIKTLPIGFLDNAKDLQELDLSWNKLQVLPPEFLNNARHLKILSLVVNKLTFLPTGFLNHATALNSLSLYLNNLESLPTGFLNTNDKLESLDLSYNNLKSLPTEFLSNGNRLQYFAISHNNLVTLPTRFLCDANEYLSIILSWNRLETLSSDFICKTNHVLQIDLSNNRLKTLSMLQSNITMRYLNVSGNQLTATTIKTLKKSFPLTKIDASSNIPETFPVRSVSNTSEVLDSLLNQTETLPTGLPETESTSNYIDVTNGVNKLLNDFIRNVRNLQESLPKQLNPSTIHLMYNVTNLMQVLSSNKLEILPSSGSDASNGPLDKPDVSATTLLGDNIDLLAPKIYNSVTTTPPVWTKLSPDSNAETRRAGSSALAKKMSALKLKTFDKTKFTFLDFFEYTTN